MSHKARVVARGRSQADGEPTCVPALRVREALRAGAVFDTGANVHVLPTDRIWAGDVTGAYLNAPVEPHAQLVHYPPPRGHRLPPTADNPWGLNLKKVNDARRGWRLLLRKLERVQKLLYLHLSIEEAYAQLLVYPGILSTGSPLTPASTGVELHGDVQAFLEPEPQPQPTAPPPSPERKAPGAKRDPSSCGRCGGYACKCFRTGVRVVRFLVSIPSIRKEVPRLLARVAAKFLPAVIGAGGALLVQHLPISQFFFWAVGSD